MKENGTGTFTGERNFTIFYRFWLPDGEIKAVVILIHGYADHSGRHTPTAEALTRAGFAVYGMDMRGHGESDGTRGDIENFDLCAADILTLLQQVKERHPDKKMFLFGHSMGGSVACLFASMYQDELDGLIVCSSLVYMSQDIPEVMKKIAHFLAALLPKLPVEKFQIDGLSKQPEVIEEYRKDPLTYTGKVRSRMGAHMLNLRLLVPCWTPLIKLPVLVLHGEDDFIIDPKGSREIYDSISSNDKTLKFLPGFYHDLFHEPESGEVFDEIAAWIGTRAGS